MNTKWTSWGNRNQIQNIQPGVYYLAHTEQNISGNDFSMIKEIIYIGVTISKGGTKGRLGQFRDTMERNYNNHGGAQRVRFKHKNSTLFFNNLYVSVLPFPLLSNNGDDLRIKGECLKHEYVSFAEYVDLYGVLPEFNDQKRSLKK